MRQHCDYVRHIATTLLDNHFKGWKMQDILHVATVIHAVVKRDAADHGEEKEFDEYAKELLSVEVQNINEFNPIEPKAFEADYDFRLHMK